MWLIWSVLNFKKHYFKIFLKITSKQKSVLKLFFFMFLLLLLLKVAPGRFRLKNGKLLKVSRICKLK